MIKDLEPEKGYTYIGVDESSGIQRHNEAKTKKGTCKKNTIDPKS